MPRFKFAWALPILIAAAACAAPSTYQKPPGAAIPEAGKPAPVSVKRQWRSDKYLVLVAENTVNSRQLAETYLGGPDKAWRIEDETGRDSFPSGSEIIIPLTDDRPLGIERGAYQIVPILCYHRFGNEIKNKLVLPADEFDRQMAYLKENNYRVIPLKMLEGFLNGTASIPRRAVVITIDDGYKSVMDVALPILVKYGYPATLFVYTDYVGAGAGALSWEDLKAMEAGGLIDIQNHSKSHANLSTLSAGGLDKVKNEIYFPLDFIGRKMGHAIPYLAYPYGETNLDVINIVKEAKIRLAMTVERGGNAFFQNLWFLKRNMIFAGENFDHFLKNIPVEEAMP